MSNESVPKITVSRHAFARYKQRVNSSATRADIIAHVQASRPASNKALRNLANEGRWERRKVRGAVLQAEEMGRVFRLDKRDGVIFVLAPNPDGESMRLVTCLTVGLKL